MSKRYEKVLKDNVVKRNLNKEILEEFLKENDMKKLIALFFEKMFNARMFANSPKEGELNIVWSFGLYEYRLQRRVVGHINNQLQTQAFVSNLLDKTGQQLQPRRF